MSAPIVDWSGLLMATGKKPKPIEPLTPEEQKKYGVEPREGGQEGLQTKPPDLLKQLDDYMAMRKAQAKTDASNSAKK